jgi:hypothetical protein
MTNDVTRIDLAAGTKQSEKFLEGGQLGWGGRCVFKVADQANSNSAGVVQGVAGMSTVHLLFPAERGFHGTILHPVAIANNKVIANTFPGIAGRIPAANVLSVNGLHAAGPGSGMVQHQKFPGFKGSFGGKISLRRIWFSIE